MLGDVVVGDKVFPRSPHQHVLVHSRGSFIGVAHSEQLVGSTVHYLAAGGGHLYRDGSVYSQMNSFLPESERRRLNPARQSCTSSHHYWNDWTLQSNSLADVKSFQSIIMCNLNEYNQQIRFDLNTKSSQLPNLNNMHGPHQAEAANNHCSVVLFMLMLQIKYTIRLGLT